MSLHFFPAINATLNAISALFLFVGWRFIRQGNRQAHRYAMTAAFCCSALFLMCYLWYHAHVGATHYQKTGIIRFIYFSILLTHTVLAVFVFPAILYTFSLALKNRFDQHRRYAKWVFPLWFYVSTTGVIIYFLLYRL